MNVSDWIIVRANPIQYGCHNQLILQNRFKSASFTDINLQLGVISWESFSTQTMSTQKITNNVQKRKQKLQQLRHF